MGHEANCSAFRVSLKLSLDHLLLSVVGLKSKLLQLLLQL